MGDYASYTDVNSELLEITINGSSTPSSTTVDAWIDQREGLVNAILKKRGYTTPVTDTADIAMLKGIVVSCVAKRVLHAKYQGNTQNDRKEYHGSICDDNLKMLADGDLELPSATRSSRIGVIRSRTLTD